MYVPSPAVEKIPAAPRTLLETAARVQIPACVQTRIRSPPPAPPTLPITLPPTIHAYVCTRIIIMSLHSTSPAFGRVPRGASDSQTGVCRSRFKGVVWIGHQILRVERCDALHIQDVCSALRQPRSHQTNTQTHVRLMSDSLYRNKTAASLEISAKKHAHT